MTDTPSTSIVWLRRDLRLSDNPALTAAAKMGAVVPVFIVDEHVRSTGAAHRWRLEQSLRALDEDLRSRGLKLILKAGDALDVLRALVAETGASAVHWSRLYDPATNDRDAKVKSALKADGISATSYPGHLLWEPWTAETKSGGFFKVYTPFWNASKDIPVPEPLPVPDLSAPETWPESTPLEALELSKDMVRGGETLLRHGIIGEAAARGRLGHFIGNAIGSYKTDRDRPDLDATSMLSENFAVGELSVRTAWHAGLRARQDGAAGAEHFLKELCWRDFAYHLLHHTPHIARDSWREEWQDFPWRGDNADAETWRRGMTGEPMVDAAMRQMYVTGKMHNRARMLVASYLTKHLMTDWRVGMAWFDDHLTDWDPASNAMGWQWTAGSGPDASPYFRIFNPATQAEKFDPDGVYRQRFIAGYDLRPDHEDALAYFDMVPRSWGMSPSDPYPERMVDLKAGRERALDAYQSHKDRAA